jgi:Tol biopolymer transport system component
VLFATILFGTLAMSAHDPDEVRFGRWGSPVSIDPGGKNSINTLVTEGCPIESPDGLSLFFASNRLDGKGGLDIWVASRDKKEQAFGDPVNLPEPVNSTGNDFCPTPLTGNRLLFVSNRQPSLCGGGDIFQTRLHPVKGWLPPENLGCQVNSPGEEYSPSLVEAEGRTILFFSSIINGTSDIYSSTLGPDGKWSKAQPVAELNTALDDARPNVRKDGLEIVFDSTRESIQPDIWTAVRPSIYHPWSKPRPITVVNSTASENRATLSRDGTRLYFGSTISGNSDLYMSKRRRADDRDNGDDRGKGHR